MKNESGLGAKSLRQPSQDYGACDASLLDGTDPTKKARGAFA